MIAALLTALWLLWPTAAAVATAAPASTAVLNSCWTPRQLAGSPADRLVCRTPDDPRRNEPPTRLEPQHALPPLPVAWRNSIRRVDLPPGEKLLALTFDLCERAPERTGYDSAIVNYLRAQSVPATFFAGGKWLRSHPEQAMQLMADPLFEIGNHAWTHGNLRTLPPAQRREQLVWTQTQYELLREELLARPCAQRAGSAALDKIAPAPRVFRFPYGACDAAALDLVAANGLAAVQWDIAPGDPVPTLSARALADDVLKRARPGSIVVLHANGRGRHTAEALPLLIPKLREKGYHFATVSDLLAAGTPVAASECYQDRPGDTLKYK